MPLRCQLQVWKSGMRMFKPAIMPLILLFACPAWSGEDALSLEQLRMDREVLRSAEQDFERHQEQG